MNKYKWIKILNEDNEIKKIRCEYCRATFNYRGFYPFYCSVCKKEMTPPPEKDETFFTPEYKYIITPKDKKNYPSSSGFYTLF